MAILIPDIYEIISFPTALQEGEKALMEMLLQTLDDDWTIYVQPHLNGLNPDIVIFSPEAGIGVFEVKDWNLNNCQVKNNGYNYEWTVYTHLSGYAHIPRTKCPFWQVKHYKDSIFQYEIPFLGGETIFDRRLYALLTPFLYFHKETTEKLKAFFEPVPRPYRYVSYFGYNDLNSPYLLQLLKSRHLKKGSAFARFMKDNDLLGQLQSALSYPKYGKFDRKNIQILTAKQRELLPNDPGGRRVLGVAGSGKTIVVVNKAVEAARENKKVLVVCFNIMMATLIKEAIYRLARIYGPNVHRNIEVAHYHRIFNTDAKHPNNLGDSLIEADSFYINRYMEEPVDVLLIDEGQDFKREWVENLQRLCAPDYHFMFFEDDRQDIYLHAQSRRKLVLPGVSGRPNLLNRTHRIPSEIAELANRLAEWANISNESGPIDIGQARPQRLFVSTKWFNGDCATGLEALLSDIEFMWNKGSFGAPADTAILVCTVEAGRQLYELLLKSPIAVQTNFERHEQYEELQRLFADDTTDRFVRELHAVRRGYKVEFRMRTDKLKISTIHSFKGWELDRILVFFDPNEHQTKVASSLLYTAITRTQNSLTVYNSYPPFFEFGQIAINERLAEEWQSPK